MSLDTSAAMPGTRNAILADMVTILRGQRARRLDVVAPAGAIHAYDGNLVIDSTVSQLGADGVTSAAGTYRPTAVADEGIADKLGISLAYLRRLRAVRPDLWDANVNGWLYGDGLAGYPADDRRFLVRLFQADGDGLGVARAFLSDSYKVIDNLDALMATLDGIRQAGTEVTFDGLDLTERRLYARVVAPSIRALAPALLAGYRSPFGGRTYVPGGGWTPEQARAAAAREGRGYAPGSEPVLFAGFVISNSEVGDGAWSITELSDAPVAAQPGHRGRQRLPARPRHQLGLDRGQLGLAHLQRGPVISHCRRQRRLGEPLPADPRPVRGRPVGVAPDPPVPHQHRGQPLLRALAVGQHRGPHPHQVPHRLLRRRGHPDRGQLPGPVQPGQPPRVPLVGLDLVRAPLGISDGATTWHATPIEASSRYSS